MESADGASPCLRLDDAGALAIAAGRALFLAITPRKAERPSRRLAIAGGEIVLASETVDLGLVEGRVIRSSHRR